MPLSQIIKPDSELLGTLTTSSGASHTLSGLDLTQYKRLFIVVTGVTFSASAPLTLGGVDMTGSGAGSTRSGISILDLTTGCFSAGISGAATLLSALGGDTTYTNATTALVFAGGTFTGGTISVYGDR